MGILDNMMNNLKQNLGRQGLGEALGILGANLMAAGATTTDPGNQARFLGRGAEGFSRTLRGGRRDAETKRFRDQQIIDMEARRAERERAEQERTAAQRMLLGPHLTGAGPAKGSFRAAQDTGTVPGGVLSDPLMRGMATIDPVKAMVAELQGRRSGTQFERQKDIKGMPLSPEQEAQQMRMYGGKAAIKAGLTPKYSGKVYLDEQVGKYYQINPKTMKREYISPNEEFAIEADGQGGFSIRKGASTGGAGGLTKATTNLVQKKLIAAKEGLTRLKGIQGLFRPEYQEIPTRLGAAWSGLKAKLGKNIDPESRGLLEDFAGYKRESIDNINLYIKDITGAQMSETEARRLRRGVPDPGDGIFDGDDPISFKAKMDNAVSTLEKAQARYRYYLQNGITNKYEMSSKSPLNDMEIAVNPKTGERLISIEGQWIPL